MAHNADPNIIKSREHGHAFPYVLLLLRCKCLSYVKIDLIDNKAMVTNRTLYERHVNPTWIGLMNILQQSKNK